MSRHLLNALEDLKERVEALGGTVQRSVSAAVEAVLEGDRHKALRVVEGDRRIDEEEVAVEEECLKVFALHQPVATDLRLLVGILKLNNDLERIGDLAVGIAGNAGHVDLEPLPELRELLVQLAQRSQSMLHQGLECLMNRDASQAAEVCVADDEVDRLYLAMRDTIQQLLAGEGGPRDRARIEGLLRLVHTARSLERVADHATNIAEDVIYMVTGEIPRHGALRNLRFLKEGRATGHEA